MKRAVLAISMMLFAVLPAVAQYGGAAVAALNSDDAGIVTGQPCAIVEKIVTTTPRANRPTEVRQVEARKWRDAQGRFREERTEVIGAGTAVFHKATIIDPIKYTITTLDLDNKTASVVHLPKGTLHPYVDVDDKPIYRLEGVQVKTEKVSGRTIAGVQAVGRRVTRTRPPGTVRNDQTLVSVSERWVSPELRIVLATSMDDPRQQQKREVTSLDRAEPDAALFQVPADYAVKEAEGRPLQPVLISPSQMGIWP